MHYSISELNSLMVKGKTPIHALKKAIRKVVSNVKKRGENIFTIQNERLTIKCLETDKESIYIFTIIKKEDFNNQRSLYYQLEYDIEIYKKLNNIE